ncbi:IrmA family protein [Enterobacter ludwigii]|uniref:IrmA family protein n=1 Tax=Enterobacter ludwigii TaxID=299767 RepID=UPI00242BF74E|nr:IrmA family protein [Enterobacter ludwigii]WGA04036.1 IrmA family protein [Enterobacter ludwigii]
MNNMLKGLIPATALSLCLLTPAHAEQRYISIRNTDTVWVPGNVCVFQFRLDNGGSGEGFGPLTLALRLKDKSGHTLATGNMAVAAFGDSDATRTQDASLEQECVENVSAVEITQAMETRDGHQVPLSLSVFDPQYYRPLPVSIATK